MIALGPSSNAQQQNRQQAKNLFDNNKIRCNSDTIFYNIPPSKFKQQNRNLQQNNVSPSVSEGFSIKEDYFNAEKQKLYFQISSRNSGNSNSSGTSNMSSDNSKKQTKVLAQANFTKSSTILKSSLEGLDSHDFPTNSSRPSKPKLDPFKKFNVQNSKNRTTRLLSFDDGARFMSQNSNSSLKSPQVNQRKGSQNIEFNSLPVQHQLIVEEAEFELNILSDVSKNQKQEETQSIFKITDDNGKESIYYPNPLKNSVSSNETQDVSQPQNSQQKYIGFLEEESNEESSSDNEDDIDEDEKISKFLSKIQIYQNQNKRSTNKASFHYESNKFQSELRQNFFNILQIREIIIEKKSRESN